MDGDIGQILQAVCNSNDHITALVILQTLARLNRNNYISVETLVLYLTYCGNAFAEHDNFDFFSEYVQYMPDINKVNRVTRFSMKCKSYYYVYKHGAHKLFTLCPMAKLDWFAKWAAKNNITSDKQLRPLEDIVNKLDYIPDPLEFKEICENCKIPYDLRTGFI